MKPILVLGLGNDLLGDDAIGLRVAEQLRGEFPGKVEVRSTSVFGLALLDELIGRERVLVIDSYVPEDFSRARIEEHDWTAAGEALAPCPHFFGLAEIRELMNRLAIGLPSEVRVLAVPVRDPFTFSLEMTPAVSALLSEAVARAQSIVSRWHCIPT